MKHQLQATANATAATVGFIYVVCALAVVALPELTMTVARSWFHGIDINLIAVNNVTPGSFILGIITAVAGGSIVGYVYAAFYNNFLKK